jgi:hypothetical protein
MANFQPRYYSYSTRYPESGQRIKFGNSYGFTATPTAPDQRVFMLKLQGMEYFLLPDGSLDLTTTLSRNLGAFEEFYREHQLHTEFNLAHPVYGTVKCKFLRPLEIPEGIRGGNGVWDTIEVELEEQP